MSKLLRKRALNKVLPLHERETISAEIFGKGRFIQHAHSLAQTQVVTDQPAKVYSFIDRLDVNRTALRQNYEEILSAVEAGKSVTPAAEWLIDNYHLIEQHVPQTRADLPVGFYRQLPKLAEGHLAGHLTKSCGIACNRPIKPVSQVRRYYNILCSTGHGKLPCRICTICCHSG